MEKQFDFISKRYFAYTISLLALFGTWIYGFSVIGPKLGIDFTGGVLIQIKTHSNKNIENIRELLKNTIKGVSIQSMQEKNEFLIRVPVTKNTDETATEVKKLLSRNFKDTEIRKIEMIGPTIGKELKRKGILSVVYALAAILIYVAWRFEMIFALTSVIALFHDALITIGMMMVTGREFSLPVIAAILTVVGYSINDTIVVFDRIRENLKIFHGQKAFDRIVNESINQTLSRTIITSLTTFFVVLCLFLFGGGTINNFAFALLTGIIVGTYSSIFIASSLVVDWYKFRKA